jgi:iron complex outermembrane recepter protein
MKKNVLLIIFLFFAIPFFAQNLMVTLKTDNNETPDFATLVLRNAKDSSLQESKTFGEKGILKIPIKAYETYFLTIEKFGFQPFSKVIKGEIKGIALDVVLKASVTSLSEVTVTHKAKLMRQEDDKTIVDAEPLARIASNAFEVIEKIPGVITVDDNVFLGKAEPARIFINGREMKMVGNDLAAILKSMPPNSIAKIELLRTPSAKYDASSSGGIINIVLKKGVRLGTNGTLNVTYSQGRLGRFSSGFTLNHGNEKQNFYFNYQYGKNNTFDSLTTSRIFPVDSSFVSQNAYTDFPNQTHYIATGFDRTINAKWSIADDVIFNLNTQNSGSRNESNIFKSRFDELQTVSNIKTNLNNDTYRQSINNTLSIIGKLDTLGSEWNTGLNFIFANNNTQQNYNNAIFPQNITLDGNGDILGQRKIFVLTSDVVKKFPKQIKLETGLKISVLNNEASSNFFQKNKIDDTKSAIYTYNENINAGYLQGSKKFKKILFKTGLRIENTNMEGIQKYPSDTTFKINRTDFFPYLYVSRDLFALFKGFMLTGNLIARRSISRPDYAALNPAVQYVDPFFVQTGNPSLRPQFTNTYEFNISFNDYPVLAVGTDDTKGVFGKVVYQNPSTKIFTETYDNLGHLRQYYMRLVGGMPPGGTYFGLVGATYEYKIYKGLYQGENLDFRRGSWTIFTYHELKFSKTFNMSLNGYLLTNGIQNFYELENIGDLSVSFNKKFPKKNLQMIVRLNDVFYTFKPQFRLNVGDIQAFGSRVFDSQRIGVTLRYNFGVENTNKKKKGNEGNFLDIVNPTKRSVGQ